MILTIDNPNSPGPIDYSAAIAADRPLRIERNLNKPSILTALLEIGTLAPPARRARIIAIADTGTILFTGYLAVEPVALYAGVATTGPVFRYQVSAISDEWLLDRQSLPPAGATLGAQAGTALRIFTQRTDAGLFSMAGVAGGRTIGVFEPLQAETWSSNAGAIAASSYSAYRVLDGALTVQPTGTVSHALDFDTGTDASGGPVSIAALTTAAIKELANDVTLSGAIEPTAYITETLAGDGSTTIFQLAETPFRPPAAQRNLVTDSFNEAVLNPQIWTIGDPGSHLSLSANGLTLSGGNGYDGQTTLTAIDPVEIGGSLLIEAGSVMINIASQGVLCGLYAGAIEIGNCLVGFNVRQSSGATVITPLIDGIETGTTFHMLPSHVYTLRIRLYSPEIQRLLQTYYATVDGAVASFGGGAVPAPATAVFDLIDLGASSNTPATILYDGSLAPPIPNTPGTCTFCVANIAQVFGSIGYVKVIQTGSAWAVSTLPSGTRQTRLIGIAGEGVDCQISATGQVTFFAGRIPVAGETIAFSYRASQRAITRIKDTTSIATEMFSNGAIPGTARWLGKVLRPLSRSTADCENAALAVLSFATSRAAAIAGTYVAVNPQPTSGLVGRDIWPGDILALTQNGASLNVIVRKVTIEPASACPEAITYSIAFANDWAEALGLTLSETIAADAILPQSAQTSAELQSATVLTNLQQLQLVSATTTALQVDAGLAPPAGGGFEVRRRDNAFGPNIAQDLVLRSPVRSFSIPREAQIERYYVRMYDASTPPLYSRFSSAVFTNLPIS